MLLYTYTLYLMHNIYSKFAELGQVANVAVCDAVLTTLTRHMDKVCVQYVYRVYLYMYYVCIMCMVCIVCNMYST